MLFAAASIDIFNPVYGVFSPPPAAILIRNGVQSLEQTGLYLQDQIKLDRLTLVLSGRNDWAELTQQAALVTSMKRGMTVQAYRTRWPDLQLSITAFRRMCRTPPATIRNWD